MICKSLGRKGRREVLSSTLAAYPTDWLPYTVAQKIVLMFTYFSKISSVWNANIIYDSKLYVQHHLGFLKIIGLYNLDKSSWSTELNKMETYWNNCLSIHFLTN
jgi:hypothetical protein